MGELNGSWVPETDAEVQLLTAVNEAMQAAHAAGLDETDIAGILTFAASGALSHDGEEDAPEASVADPSDEVRECPACGEPIEDVKVFMGGNCRVVPCGHEMDASNLGQWVDKPGDSNGDFQ